MTHQQKNTSTTRNKDKNSGHGKNKQNNFRLSLPGKSNIYGITSNWITLQKNTGMGILRKFQQYRRLPQDPPPGPPHHLEEELDRLTGKIVRISPPAPELAVTRSPSVVRTASCSRSRVRTRRRPGPTRRSAWCAAPTEPACRPCPAATRSAGGDSLIFRGDILI